jgi:hypothetical protein
MILNAPLKFETRSFPDSLVAYPSDFTFYVLRPCHFVHSRAARISQSVP